MRRFGPVLWMCFDVLLALALIVVAEVEIATGASYETGSVWPGPPALTRIVVVFVIAPVVLRRIRPAVGLVLSTGLLVLDLLALGLTQSGVGFVLLVVIVYSGAAHLARAWPSLAAAAVLLVVILTRPGSITGVGDLVFFLGLNVVAVVLGRAVRLRHEQILRLRRQQRELERLHAAEVEAATAAERAAIARELHDIVAHAITVVVIQAQVGERMLRHDPPRAGEALRTIESSGRAALVELRRLLTVLEGDVPSEGTAPTPSVANLTDVVRRLEAAGLAVDLEQDALPELPPATELVIHRTVQEALTNALKHAPGQPARVRIRVCPDAGVVITVENALGSGSPNGSSVPGSARGLIGMRQRLELVGGHLETGAAGSVFTVRATLPLSPDVGPRAAEPAPFAGGPLAAPTAVLP